MNQNADLLADRAAERRAGAFWKRLVIGMLLFHASAMFVAIRIAVGGAEPLLARSEPQAAIEFETASEPEPVSLLPEQP